MIRCVEVVGLARLMESEDQESQVLSEFHETIDFPTFAIRCAFRGSKAASYHHLIISKAKLDFNKQLESFLSQIADLFVCINQDFFPLSQ